MILVPRRMMHKDQKDGFTLVEILVAVTIIAILAIIIVQVFITTVRVNTKTEIMKEIKQNGDYAMSIMTRMIQNAQDITCTSAHSISVTDNIGTTTTLSTTTNAGSCRITNGATYLTADHVTAATSNCSDAITFSCESLYNGEISSVSIQFQLMQINNNPVLAPFERARMEFNTNVAVRNINI